MTLENLCEEMKFVAMKSGKMGLDMQKDLNFLVKSSHKDIVTNADIQIEKYIKRALEHHNFDYLCEESGAADTANSKTWIVDPIDGTVNYFHKHPDWAISIALKEEDEIVAGVIHSPSDDRTYHAVKGQGAFLNGQPISPSTTEKLKDAFLNFAYLDDISRFTKLGHNFWDLSQKSDVMGSMGKAFCYVAEGIYDASIGISSSIWDYAAASLILKESGAGMYDFNGNTVDLTKEKEHVFAVNPRLYDKLMTHLAFTPIQEVVQK